MLVSDVQQSDSVIHVHISILFQLLSHLGYYRILTPVANFLKIHSMFWITVLHQHVFCKYFLPICSLSSHSLDSIFCCTKTFTLRKFSLSFLSFLGCRFGVTSMLSPNPRLSRFSSRFFCNSLLVLQFPFMSVIQFE